jgi:apocytochrome f
MKKKLFKFLSNFFVFLTLNSYFNPLETLAFPIYAQQSYENPREPNGKIVCANCHLAQKPVELEIPKSILPNSVFETIVKIPVNKENKQILSNGAKGDLNIGAVLILPEEFKLAPKNRLTSKLQEDLKNSYITPYNTKFENILVVGPISSKKSDEIIFPILSPDPETNKNVFYLKYPIFVGGNRGRGQIYPNGEKTNNNIITALATGKISKINYLDKTNEIQILDKTGNIITQSIPKNVDIIVKENQSVNQDQSLTINPNVGGFGQIESEIVLQNPSRIYYYTLFCLIIVLTQSIFVLKKKQFEKVQLAEMDF